MSHSENLHESIMAKIKTYENFFMRRLAEIKGWTNEKPSSSGFYFVRADSAAEPAVHCYVVNKWHPFEHNTVLNEMVPAGDAVEYLGPFFAENYIHYVSAFCSSMEVRELGVDLGREDEIHHGLQPKDDEKLVVLEEGKVSFFTCKYCETPIYLGEAFSSDGGTYWHKECEGEVSCDEG